MNENCKDLMMKASLDIVCKVVGQTEVRRDTALDPERTASRFSAAGTGERNRRFRFGEGVKVNVSCTAVLNGGLLMVDQEF